MNYRHIYMLIIEHAKKETELGLRPKNFYQRKNFPNQYFEFHHILPKSLFPLWTKRKSNIVALTAREHFFCHQLLTKIYPGKPMFFALWQLCNDGQNNYCNKSSKTYEHIRIQHYNIQKDIWNNKSAEELKIFSKNRSASQKQIWQNRTELEKSAISKKLKGIWASKTVDEKKEIMKKAWQNRDTSNFKKKVQEKWNSKSNEEKAEITNKRVSTFINNPDHDNIVRKRAETCSKTRGRKVICIETKEIFNSARRADLKYPRVRVVVKQTNNFILYNNTILHFKYLDELE